MPYQRIIIEKLKSSGGLRMGASSGIGAGGGGIGSGVSTTGTGQYTPNDPAEKTEPKSEWSSIFVDGEVTDIEHVVLPLKHGLLGKDTRLGTKKLVVRIKPGGRLAIKTINAWNNEETEYQTVRPEGWELDIDVLEAMNEVRPNAESQLYGPCIYVDLSKLPVNDDDEKKRLGFWFQVSDIEWKLVEGS